MFPAYDGAQLSWNAFHHAKHFPGGSTEQAGKSTTNEKSPEKATQETEQSLASGHLNSHIAAFFISPVFSFEPFTS